jgi:hypothetical protein
LHTSLDSYTRFIVVEYKNKLKISKKIRVIFGAGFKEN